MSDIRTTMERLRQAGIPVAYGRFRKTKDPPFVIYIGRGQENTVADDTYYHSEPNYQIEYYFSAKNETIEAAIEQILLEDGWLYEKSSETYIESEDLWVIYYNI